jgi:AraC family transcriptional regulator, regulatory protein of adaptative response / methylated-DNA-[protein]-cysteine methyltransferase
MAGSWQLGALEENFVSFFRSRTVLRLQHNPRMMLVNDMSSVLDRPLPLLPMPTRQEMERAYQESDASYDGVFYLGVRTTGIFCRPSCPARKPKPENVEFFPLPKDALFAGYRPCRRCHPLESDQAPSWLSRLLERIEQLPDARIRERDLRAMDIEPARVRRYFLARYGLTFQAYCRARRLARAFERIRDGETIDDAVFETGYESHSGFREAFQKAFGQPPGRSAEAGCIRLAWMTTPLGPMIAGATDAGICLLEFTDRRLLEQQLATLRRRFRAALAPDDHPHLQTLRTELDEYFAGARSTFSVPIDAPGSPFEERVWRALREIPYGETRSYTDVARAIGHPAASRAVGRANGLNRIAIVIPCHRVVNTNGELGGYGGGLWRKRRLLDIEGAGLASSNPAASITPATHS